MHMYIHGAGGVGHSLSVEVGGDNLAGDSLLPPLWVPGKTQAIRF